VTEDNFYTWLTKKEPFPVGKGCVQASNAMISYLKQGVNSYHPFTKFDVEAYSQEHNFLILLKIASIIKATAPQNR
jgi:hypothetical protein